MRTETSPTAKTDATTPTGRQGTAPESAAAQKIDLRFDLLFSAIYHDMCEARFLRIHRMLTAFVLFLGTGAVAAYTTTVPELGQLAGLLIAIFSAVQLVWDFSGRAKQHADLRLKFYTLLGDLEGCATEPDVRGQMTATFGIEPPIVERLRSKAHNQAGRSLFGDDFHRA